VVFSLVQVLFESFLARSQHVFHALRQQVSDLYALIIRVLELVTRYLLDDRPLISSHRLEDEGQAQLLIVVLGGVSVRLPLQLVFEDFEGVQREADKVVLVQQLIREQYTRL